MRIGAVCLWGMRTGAVAGVREGKEAEIGVYKDWG